LIKKLANKNKRKGEQKQRDETRIHSPSYLLLRKTKRRPRRGATAAKTSPPPCDEGGVVDTRTPEELEPNDRLLQKSQDEVRIRKSAQQNKDK